MAEISRTHIGPAAAGSRRSPHGLARRFGKWLASDRVFPKIPFMLVEGLFFLVILVPFILTIYISLLKWRANRPFEQAFFSGFENYEAVLESDLFWFALGRTFYFSRRLRSRSSWWSASCWPCWSASARDRRSSTPRSSWCR